MTQDSSTNGNNMANERHKTVFVSGCYDMLHSGHVAFFEEAASYGDLYVGLGSDQTIWDLKGRKNGSTTSGNKGILVADVVSPIAVRKLEVYSEGKYLS